MIRIGIVGCGRILAAHLRGYRLLREAGIDDFRITALCARRADDALMYVRRGTGPQQRAPVGTAPGDPLSVGDEYLSDFQDDVEVEIYSDYRRMIAEGSIDAVNDFTTHALHHQVADVALRQGKHLMTQKPLAVSVAAGRKMCQQAEGEDLVLGVFENARFRTDTRQLKWLFDDHRCGPLKMILMTNVGNWWAPDQIVAETPWRHQRVQGGGITLDIGVHLFNHFRYVAGEIRTVSGHVSVQEPVRCCRDAQGQVLQRVPCDADDTTFAHFTTQRGVLGNITASWSGHGQPALTGRGRGIVYYGSSGSVVADQLKLDDGTAYALEAFCQQNDDAGQLQRHFPLGLGDDFALNQHDWLDSIRQRRPPETSGAEGLRDLAAAFSVLESSVAGRTVEVEEVLSGALRDYQAPIDQEFGLL